MGPKLCKATPHLVNVGSYSNVVEECQRMRFKGGVTALYECGPVAIKWLEELKVQL